MACSSRHNKLSKSHAAPIVSNIRLLPEQLVASTLKTVFGMYVDPELDSFVKDNLRLIIPVLWDTANKPSKHDIGLRYATFSANADLPRKSSAYEFLSVVKGGLTFLPKEQGVVEMDEVLDALWAAHNAFNNFYNEPIHARSLIRYVPKNGDIPKSITKKYVKVLVMCRIGNKYGISSGALEYYDEMINRFCEIVIG